jgi:1-acyl-sn-glycerol-3-phosphate acyltransferase
MLNAFTGNLKGVIAAILITLSTLIHFTLLILTTLVKIVIPLAPVRRQLTRLAIGIATSWVGFNSWLFDTLHHIEWEVSGDTDLKPDEWYFVTCNHQSWSDIAVVQRLLLRKIPMLKFFLKQELIWVPILGLCWWALDFPFMKR